MKRFSKAMAVFTALAFLATTPGLGVYSAIAAQSVMRGRATAFKAPLTQRRAPTVVNSSHRVNAGFALAQSAVIKEGARAAAAQAGVGAKGPAAMQTAAGMASAMGRRDARRSAEAGYARGNQAWENVRRAESNASVLAAASGAAGQGSGLAGKEASQAPSVGIAAAPTPGRLETAANVASIPVLASAYGLAVPAMTALGLVIYMVFSTGINAVNPLNWGHYAMAAVSHGLTLVSGIAAPLVEPVNSAGQSAISAGQSGGPIMYVWGQIVQLYGQAAALGSSALNSVAIGAESAASLVRAYTPGTMDLSASLGLKDIPAKNWYVVTAVLANMAYYGRATHVTDRAAKDFPRLSQIAAVRLVTRAVDLALVAPAMLFKDLFDKLVKPLIEDAWRIVKDVARDIYDRVLTPIGHVARGLAVGAVMAAYSSVIGPIALVYAGAKTFLVTPAYRVLKITLGTKAGVGLAAGVILVAALGPVFGLYSVAAGLAGISKLGSSLLLAAKTTAWVLTFPYLAAGLARGAYYGYNNGIISAIGETHKDIVGKTMVFVKKAEETFMKAVLERN